MHKHSLATISQHLQDKQYSSEEITRVFLERIEKFDPSLNSFISVCPEFALEQAKKADQKIMKGEHSPLLGVPFAHKDIFCTQGIKTSCGSKMLDNFIAPYNATVVNNLEQAGMVMLGKTNMDEFAMGSSNENSYYGACKNPWDIQCVPGGSSGGSASAVAARLTPAATGTDTGGSIRQPAAFCNLTGLKPTYGRVSRYGMVAFVSSLDQAGPMAQSAEDCALMLNAMAGFDVNDSTSIDKPVPNYKESLEQSLQGLKIGLPKQYFSADLAPEIADLVQKAAQQYEQLGASLVEIDLPNSDLSVPAYYIVAPAECSSNLARFDGVRYGYRCDDPKNLLDMYMRSRGEAFGAEVKRRIILGSYVLCAGYYDAYYVKAQKIRRLISNDFAAAFENVDLILGPTTPSSAFKIGEKVEDPISMYLSDIYTIAVNLAGLPALSLPAGFIKDMPIGMQLIGNYFSEERLLNAGHLYQQQTDWHLRNPQNFE